VARSAKAPDTGGIRTSNGPEFSLVRGDLPFRLQRRIGLAVVALQVPIGEPLLKLLKALV